MIYNPRRANDYYFFENVALPFIQSVATVKESDVITIHVVANSDSVIGEARLRLRVNANFAYESFQNIGRLCPLVIVYTTSNLSGTLDVEIQDVGAGGTYSDINVLVVIDHQ